jgi:hypothetical protein
LSDFFMSLARATVEPGATLRPRLASRFEPLAPLEAAEVRSAEPFPQTFQEKVTPRQPDAVPVPAAQPPEEPAVVARLETATRAVESPHTPRADRRSSLSPFPSPDRLLLNADHRDDRVPPRPTGARAQAEAAAVPPETPRPIRIDAEETDRAPGRPADLLPRLASPLSPPRPEAALVPAAPARLVPTIAWPQPPGPSPEPTVHVTIGRIDIRAVTPGPRDRAAKAEKPTGIMSLDEYVERRRGGRR